MIERVTTKHLQEGDVVEVYPWRDRLDPSRSSVSQPVEHLVVAQVNRSGLNSGVVFADGRACYGGYATKFSRVSE